MCFDILTQHKERQSQPLLDDINSLEACMIQRSLELLHGIELAGEEGSRAAYFGNGRHLDGDMRDAQGRPRDGGAADGNVVIHARVVVIETPVQVSCVAEHHVHHPRILRHLCQLRILMLSTYLTSKRPSYQEQDSLIALQAQPFCWLCLQPQYFHLKVLNQMRVIC